MINYEPYTEYTFEYPGQKLSDFSLSGIQSRETNLVADTLIYRTQARGTQMGRPYTER